MPLDLSVQGFEVGHFGSRMMAMAKPCFVALQEHVDKDPDHASCLVFVPSRKQTQLSAIDLMTYAAAAGDPLFFVGAGATQEQLQAVAAADVEDPVRVEEGGLS